MRKSRFTFMDYPRNMLKRFKFWLFRGQLEQPLTKWPYVAFPSRAKFGRRPQYLNKKAPNFEIHALILNTANLVDPANAFSYTRRVLIRLSDYKFKKNIIICFLPCTITARSIEMHRVLLQLDANFKKFQEQDTEVLIVIPSFGPEIRWILNLSKDLGGLRGLRYPIILDPWWLLTRVYNSQDQKFTPMELQSYTTFFINKKGRIRAINYFDRKLTFNCQKLLQLIAFLKD